MQDLDYPVLPWQSTPNALDSRRDTDPPLEGVPWYIDHNARPVTLTVYEREIELREAPIPDPTRKPPHRTRGDIRRFSPHSRIRLLRVLHQMCTVRLTRPLFLTVTTRHGHIPPEQFREVFLRKFLPGLKRLWGRIAVLWRLEPHRDGYPHFHLICWGVGATADLHKQSAIVQAKRLWWALMGDHTKAHREHSVTVVPLQGMTDASKYVAKYCAKEQDSACPDLLGRRWGRTRDVDCRPILRRQLPRRAGVLLRWLLHRWLKEHLPGTRNSSEYVLAHSRWWLWLETAQIRDVFRAAGLQSEAARVDSLMWLRETTVV